MAALNAIMAEWGSSTSYTVKIRHLMGLQAGGKNGTTRLTKSTVQNNHKVSTLTGGLGLDWFWASAADHVTDLNKGGAETKTSL